MQYYGLPECKMICTILHVTSINQQSMAAYRIQDKKIKTNSAEERILAVSVNCIFTRNLARSCYNNNNTFSPASAFFSFCYNLVRLSYFFPNLSEFTYNFNSCEWATSWKLNFDEHVLRYEVTVKPVWCLHCCVSY